MVSSSNMKMSKNLEVWEHQIRKFLNNKGINDSGFNQDEILDLAVSIMSLSIYRFATKIHSQEARRIYIRRLLEEGPAQFIKGELEITVTPEIQLILKDLNAFQN